jgi:GH15 family glucan-1,4-alpha-glucosidase
MLLKEFVEGTMNSIQERLLIRTTVGGLARYENDEYQRVSREVIGNPWFICTLWLARWHIARVKSSDQLEMSLELISWAAKHALPLGVMAEQVHPFTGEPVSVCPLVLSHAEFVIAVCEYLEKYRELSSITGADELKEV